MGNLLKVPEAFWKVRYAGICRTTKAESFTEVKEFCQFLRAASSEDVQNVKVVVLRGAWSAETLQQLPVNLSRFRHLLSLTITHVRLEQLSWPLSMLRELTHLDLSHNCIKSVKFILTLKNLEHLNLESNLIIDLPSGILSLRRLKILNVAGNETIVCPPYETCLKGWEAIKSFLMDNTKTDLWEDSKLFYSDSEKSWQYKGIVDSLFNLSVDVILKSEIEFLSPAYVAPRIKTYLTEQHHDKTQLAIKLAKCSNCRMYFSDKVHFRAHLCRASTTSS